MIFWWNLILGRLTSGVVEVFWKESDLVIDGFEVKIILDLTTITIEKRKGFKFFTNLLQQKKYKLQMGISIKISGWLPDHKKTTQEAETFYTKINVREDIS